MSPATVREFFEALPSCFHADAAEGLTAVYQFDLSGDQGGQYQLHVADQACRVSPGIHPSPNVTLSMAGDTSARWPNTFDASTLARSPSPTG